ncbi:MAG TPA: M1 family aminopeptidase [Chryseosolibacter sp.]
MKRILFFLLLLPFVGYCQDSQPRPSEVIDVLNYRFRIELNDTTDRIAAVAEITAKAKKASTEIQLDLMGLSSGKGMQVSEVKSKNNSLKFVHQNNKVSITLPRPLNAGEQFQFTISYSGIPADGLIISKNKFGDRTFFADNWPNRGRNWLAIVDHPADKAAVVWEIIAPLHYEVIANGVREEETYLNRRQKVTRYKEETPISTKVMVIGVARFAVEQAGMVNGIPVETWVYPQQRKEGFSDFAVGPKILDFFQNHVGPYSYKKLANVQSKTTFGGLENASAIFYNESLVTGTGQYEMTVAHEIAHQWFGDSASELDWPHVWLSEGFASYFAILFAEFTYGEDRRRTEMTNDRLKVLKYYKTDPTPIIKTNEPDPMKLLTANSYEKASWFLHMLRREVGDKAFWVGIRNYYNEFRDSNALTEDFQRIMENASGKDLKPMFQQWLYKAGHPVLEVGWSYDETAKVLKVDVRQMQKEGAFTFPLEIGVFSPESPVPVTHTIYINRETQTFELKIPSKPAKIALDPYVNLLFDGKLKN